MSDASFSFYRCALLPNLNLITEDRFMQIVCFYNSVFKLINSEPLHLPLISTHLFRIYMHFLSLFYLSCLLVFKTEGKSFLLGSIRFSKMVGFNEDLSSQSCWREILADIHFGSVSQTSFKFD